MSATNDQALGVLTALIAKLRELEQAPERVAPRVVAAVKEVLTAQIAGSRFPSGAPWPETQDGRKALANAAAALTVTAHGSVIVARLDGPEARHSVGAVRGHVQRQILPNAKGQLRALGDAVSIAIDDYMAEELSK